MDHRNLWKSSVCVASAVYDRQIKWLDTSSYGRDWRKDCTVWREMASDHDQDRREHTDLGRVMKSTVIKHPSAWSKETSSEIMPTSMGSLVQFKGLGILDGKWVWRGTIHDSIWLPYLQRVLICRVRGKPAASSCWEIRKQGLGCLLCQHKESGYDMCSSKSSSQIAAGNVNFDTVRTYIPVLLWLTHVLLSNFGNWEPAWCHNINTFHLMPGCIKRWLQKSLARLSQRSC